MKKEWTQPKGERRTLSTNVSCNDFFAYLPQHRYLYVPMRDLWPASSIDAVLRPVKIGTDKDGKDKFISASRWLDQNRAVQAMTWAPGFPMIVEDRLISDGGWITRHGCKTFNQYRPPAIVLGDATKAGKWIDHVKRLYPEQADHIIRWLAHRIQRPHEKINHALFIGGPQGIGKDTILYPVKHSVGQWNVSEILPPTLLGRFNHFVKSVLLCVNEVHDLGELNRFGFYERLKAYTVAPPDVIRVDEKHLREYSVLNVCGVVLTSNYKTGGLYLPADDRRHFVAWSDATKDDFTQKYWRDIYVWYDRGGCGHVAAYLAQLDLSGFNPKAPPPKTPFFWEIVESNRAPENAELADILERLGNPDVVTKADVIEVADDDFASWLRDRRNARLIPHRFEECGYVAVRNPHHVEGQWRVKGRIVAIYSKATLSIRDQFGAVNNFVEANRS
jgi:hypothetical protein